MREIIQCLLDWLNQEPSDEKSHRILRALAMESLKKADFEEHKRSFTAEELVAAASEEPEPIDSKKWLDWLNISGKYWPAREPQIIQLAKLNGLQAYPKPERKSTKGGPGNRTTFYIKAVPLPESQADDELNESITPIANTRIDHVYYDLAAHGSVTPAWIVNWLFRHGQIVLKTWHAYLIVGWMTIVGLFALALSLICWVTLNVPKPFTSGDLTLFITAFIFPYAFWIGLLKPWVRLFEDRIVFAHDLFVKFTEKPAQFELLRDGDLRLIRLVRYTATCPLCGATLYLEDGAPDYRRRLVGRCYDSPREHVYSFDRVTRKGRLLISQ